MKKEEQEQVIRKTIKMDSFLTSGSKSSVVRPGTSTTCTDTTQSKKNETDSNSAARQQLSPVEQSASKKDNYDFDNEAVEESSITSMTIEDPSPNPTSSTSNEQVLTTVNLNKDPALWEINDTLRRLSQGPIKTNLVIYLKVRKYMAIGVVSCHKRSVYCGPCLAFGPLENKTQFENEGFNDWKNAEHRVVMHENSARHKYSILSMKTRSAINGRLDNLLQVQIDEEITYWRNVLKRVVAVVKRLCSRGLAFRGKTENFGDPHNGNYCMMLELLAEFDPFLASHIERFGNQGSGNTNYLSKTVCYEFIFLMGQKVLKQISDEIRRAKYFSLIIDSTPDIAHVDQLTLVIRYVLESGEPCERFLKFCRQWDIKLTKCFQTLFRNSKHWA
ncbi:Zinc finger MYM-type protein 1 [Eumeta japonica]|uniref:Zinc finger MYM-type protein 1 n=1 Tax=Eumeta variegata TaxID=151549 RepID=A0A4C1XQT6_EUMVA|nr:Zinc finger MYM-type protein 1 [Eumeta japonica]